MPGPKVIDFLEANKPITAAKDELPSSGLGQVLREAILHVAINLHKENASLKAELRKSESQASG